MCDVLETVWSEPDSPVDEEAPAVGAGGKKANMMMSAGAVANGNLAAAMKAKAFFAALDNMLSDGTNGDSPDGGDPDQLFLLPDRVLTVDSLTFREEMAAVAPEFLSPVTPTTPSSSRSAHFANNVNNNNHSSTHSFTNNASNGYSIELPPSTSSLDSNDSNRSSVRLVDDTEGLIITRACNGCLWLCKCRSNHI